MLRGKHAERLLLFCFHVLVLQATPQHASLPHPHLAVLKLCEVHTHRHTQTHRHTLTHSHSHSHLHTHSHTHTHSLSLSLSPITATTRCHTAAQRGGLHLHRAVARLVRRVGQRQRREDLRHNAQPAHRLCRPPAEQVMHTRTAKKQGAGLGGGRKVKGSKQAGMCVCVCVCVCACLPFCLSLCLLHASPLQHL